ncbi:uncharacterized protein Tco025E_01309 [Trypanosoma conorhini]|uniref:Uncharacterized protein n=1 Tax=Trypanosoma conorhini TaxID=83891 RepID=A0A3R7NSU8_9TRYP|nr:uncharacterized protein Tco025E_01309 [Trypanosoma conorhini]RNF26536.1 hypothetical protein Tco025E_01309 [Trypanosoma conorhini]
MDERELAQLVESSDAAALQAYIRDGRSPFSQPLGAEARFAYFHLPRKDGVRTTSGASTAARDERRSVPPFEEYHGPATTFVLRPQEKERALKRPAPRLQTSAPVDRAPHRRPNLSEHAWVIQSNGWTGDVLRHPPTPRFLSASHDAWQQQRKPSSRAPPQPSGAVTTPPRSAASSPGCAARETGNIGWQPGPRLQACESKSFCEELRCLEMEERRERSEKEAAFDEFLIGRHRWRHSSLDRCAKERSELGTAESIVRCAIIKEESFHYKEILAKCLDDIAGCRWDGVRMQWLQRQMANSVTMRQWVELNSILPRGQGSGQDIALDTVDCTCNVGEQERGSPPVRPVNAQQHPSTPLPEAPLSHGAGLLAKTNGTPPKAFSSTAVPPSRPRVFPPVVPHEECTMS